MSSIPLLTATYADWSTLLHTYYYSLRRIIEPPETPINEVHRRRVVDLTELLLKHCGSSQGDGLASATFLPETNQPYFSFLASMDVKACFERSREFSQLHQTATQVLKNAAEKLNAGDQQVIDPEPEFVILNDVVECLLAQIQSYRHHELENRDFQ